MITLHHFSKNLVQFDYKKIYEDLKFTPSKPKGFWLSCEKEYGWSQWCKDENWRLDGLKYVYEVKLVEKNLLNINSSCKFDKFQRLYGYNRIKNKKKGKLLYIDWEKVYKNFDGIIISPYREEKRLESHWYYGWDCASACVWDLSCILSFELLKSNGREGCL